MIAANFNYRGRQEHAANGEYGRHCPSSVFLSLGYSEFKNLRVTLIIWDLARECSQP